MQGVSWCACMQVGLVFSIYSFASVAASPAFGRLVQLGYLTRRSLLLAGLLVVRTAAQSRPAVQLVWRLARHLRPQQGISDLERGGRMVSTCAQVCFSTALFGFVSEMQHEQGFLWACLVLRAIMGEACKPSCPVHGNMAVAHAS